MSSSKAKLMLNAFSKGAIADRYTFGPFGLSGVVFARKGFRKCLFLPLLQLVLGRKAKEFRKPDAIQACVSSSCLFDLMVSTTFPFARMTYDSRTYHVQMDIDHTSPQMITTLHSRGVISILPKGSLAFLADVELLSRAPSHQLHSAWYGHAVCFADEQQVDMVTRRDVVQDDQPESLAGFK